MMRWSVNVFWFPGNIPKFCKHLLWEKAVKILMNKPQAFSLIWWNYAIYSNENETPHTTHATPAIVQKGKDKKIENEHHPETQTIYHRQDMFKSLNECFNKARVGKIMVFKGKRKHFSSLDVRRFKIHFFYLTLRIYIPFKKIWWLGWGMEGNSNSTC